MATLEEDIEHLKEVLVLQNFGGCDECKADHERLLGYLEELKRFRDSRAALLQILFDHEQYEQNKDKDNGFYVDYGGHGV